MNWVQINIQVNEDFRYMKISHICTAVDFLLPGAASPLPPGTPRRVASPGPMPRPAQPILPRERTAMDKVILII